MDARPLRGDNLSDDEPARGGGRRFLHKAAVNLRIQIGGVNSSKAYDGECGFVPCIVAIASPAACHICNLMIINNIFIFND